MAVHTFTTLTAPEWERQPGETTTAYSRFRLYRDQDSARRSLWDVATAARVSDRSVHELAEKHRWNDRVHAYDQHVEDTAAARAAAAHRRRRNQITTSLLTAQTDLAQYVRASVHHLTTSGQWLEPTEIGVIADAVATLSAVTALPAEPATDTPAAAAHIAAVGLHIAELATAHTTADGTVLDRGTE